MAKPPKTYKPALKDFMLKLLVYGDPGVGKTTFAVTANKCKFTAPALLLNVEAGTLAVAGSGIDVVDIDRFKDVEDIFWWLEEGKHKFKTVIIDTITELQAKSLDLIIARVLGKVTSRGIKRDNPDDIFQDDYGESTRMMRRVLRAFRDLPMHVILTAHSRAEQDANKVEVVSPLLTPSAMKAATANVDIVGYLYVDREDKRISRRLLVQPVGKWVAKDRSPGGRLGTVVKEPTIKTIVTKIINQEGGKDA